MKGFASKHLWYLGGPMTGYPDFNFPAFDEAERILSEKYNLNVLSAHKVDHGEHTGSGTQPWKDYLSGDLRVLLQCTGAIFLQGWPTSKGARLEFDIAADLEYPIYQFLDSPVFGTTLVPLTRPESFQE